jgi:hypothetical protein
MTFEDRLLLELKQHVADRPAPAPRRVGRIAIPSAVLAAIAAAAVLIVSAGGESAYAVESQADGTISVTINDLSDAAGLEAKLREAGVPADVDYAEHIAACKLVPGEQTAAAGSDAGPSFSPQGEAPPPGAARAMTLSIRSDKDGSTTFSIDPGLIQAGQSLRITTAGTTATSVMVAIVRDGETPPPLGCVPRP